ncbi:hypothetical protein ACWA7J_00630 [Leptothrix sp. BB-4]
MSRPARERSAQRGAGSLPVLMLLLLGLLLFLLHSHQALLGQTRQVGRQVQGAAAHEAAEAGVSWVTASLNQAGVPSGGARERLVVWPDGAWPRPRQDGASQACTQDAATPQGWRCAGVTSEANGVVSAATPPRPAGDGAPHPAWLLQLAPGPVPVSDPGGLPLLSLSVTGCSHAVPGCAVVEPIGATPPDAIRRLHLTLALLGDLASAPDAALSAGGAVRLGAGSRAVRGTAGSGGPVIEAGGAITLANGSRVQGPPGSSPDDQVSPDRVALRSAPHRWWRHFGASAALMRQLPSLRHVACPTSACSTADLAAARTDGARALWIDGELNLASGTWGSVDRPLLLVVDGTARMTGPVQGVGWLIAGALDWHAGPTPDGAGSRWQGAVTTWGDAMLDGPVDLIHDAQVLAAMRGHVGSWMALPGSWRDHGP